MQIKGLRMPIIIITACLALGILTGGQWAYREYSIQRPFVEKISNLPNIRSANFKDSGKTALLEVELDSAANLPTAISQLKEIVINDYNKQVELRLDDQRNEELSNILSVIQFHIYEALVNGNYTEMYSNIKNIMDDSQVDQWKIKIDNHYIYLEIYKNTHYLYEVIPRNQQLLVIGGDEENAAN